MPSETVGPGVFKPAYARAPFVFALARASTIPGPILVSLMSDMEGTPAANKALLHRMTAGGALELTRNGRVGTYRMAGRLLTGFTAVRGDGTLRSGGWDGRFHTLIYEIPEARRRQRDRFLMAAHQVGYRLLRPGLLISPTDEHHVLAGLGELGVVSGWITFPESDTPSIVSRAWRLEDFRAEYDDAIAALERTLTSDLEGVGGAPALRLLYEAEAPHTALLLRDGALPSELTPPDWPAGRLAALLQEVELRLAPAAVAHVHAVIASSPHAHLVTTDDAWPVDPPIDAN